MSNTEIKHFKELNINDDVMRGEVKTFSQFKTITGTGLQWYMVEREAEDWSLATDNLKNLFKSFGIAKDGYIYYEDLYDAKRMIFVSFDLEDDETYIDGSNFRLNVPVGTGDSQYVTFYSSTYDFNMFEHHQSDVWYRAAKEYDESHYGGTYAYLFPNSHGDNSLSDPFNVKPTVAGWHMPYSGRVNPTINQNYLHSVALNSWITSSATTVNLTWDYASTYYNKRLQSHLAAVHYTENRRGWDGAAHGGTRNIYDQPYGIVFLERGIAVIFDKNEPDFELYDFINDFIGNIDNLYTGTTGDFVWTGNQDTFRAIIPNGDNWTNNSDRNNRQKISFTGTNAVDNASASFRTINKSHKLIYFCHAAPGEFNSTTNSTYDHARAIGDPMGAYSIWITEIDLYGSNPTGEVTAEPYAYAKLSEPVEKSKIETLTFKIELEL